MTWAAYDSGVKIIERDDPGMVMLWLMQCATLDMQRDYCTWLNQSDSRGNSAVNALFSTATADKLKEQYLDFVARFCEEFGRYECMYSTIEISEVEDDA